MANFSQSLAQYSQAVANRKTRREIKRQQEEAEAARKAASNARSNNGLISTLGGAAAAIGVGAATGWNPATMALAYQGGSALAGGLNRTVKPYNSQELAGMPYTQPSGWETLNQVAPSVMGAYGAYQQNQAKLQQDEYSNSINNILNLTKIGDLNPAATTEMIGKLNEQHTAKYELDSPPGYMMDVSTLDSLGTGDKGWSAQKATFAEDIKGGIERGDVAAIEALQGSNMWQYHKGVSYEEAIRQAQTNKAALAAKANRADQLFNNSAAEAARQNQQHLWKIEDRFIKRLDELPDSYFMQKDGLAQLQEALLQNEGVTKDSPLYSRMSNLYSKKRFELNKPLYEETMETALTSLREDKGVTMDYKSFRKLAVEQLGHSEEFATMLYENAIAGGKGDRAEAFYEDVNKLKMTKIDLFGEETPRDADTLEREIRYMGKIQGIADKHIDFAVRQMREATSTEGTQAGPQANRPTETVYMSPEAAPPNQPLPPHLQQGLYSQGVNVSRQNTQNTQNTQNGSKTFKAPDPNGDAVVSYINNHQAMLPPKTFYAQDPNHDAELRYIDAHEQMTAPRGGVRYSFNNAPPEMESEMRYISNRQNNPGQNQLRFDVEFQRGVKPPGPAEGGTGEIDNTQEAPIAVGSDGRAKNLKVNDPPAATTSNLADKRADELKRIKQGSKINIYDIPQPGGFGLTRLPPDLRTQLEGALKAGNPKEVTRLANIAAEQFGLEDHTYKQLLQEAQRMNAGGGITNRRQGSSSFLKGETGKKYSSRLGL